MTRSLCCALLCAVAFCSVAPAADAILVINADGSYQVMVDGPDGKSVLQNIGQVIDKRGGTPPGGGGGPLPPPPTDTLETRIAAMSKAKISDGGVGSALAVGLNVALKRVSSDSEVEQYMSTVVTAVGMGTTNKPVCDAWYAELKKTPGFTHTVAGLRSTVTALTQAFNVDPNVMKTVVDESIAAYDRGDGPSVVLEKLSAAHPEAAAAFDFMKIVELIMAILDLLKNLKFFGKVILGGIGVFV